MIGASSNQEKLEKIGRMASSGTVAVFKAAFLGNS
jgi:hypothetical protein